MDRRGFLKTSGAAAMAGGSAGHAEAAGACVDPPAPTPVAGVRVLGLWSEIPSTPAGFGPERLMQRIERATGGRFRFERVAREAEADVTFGNAARHANLHPTFALFAGLPFSQGLDAQGQHAWLSVGGGEMLWDDLAADFGFKPLLAGHTGSSSCLWAGARLERASDFAGATIHALGVAAGVMRELGARCEVLAPHELSGAIAEGRLRAAEWLGPLAAGSPSNRPIAQRVYDPGFHRGGMMLSLGVSRKAWDALDTSEKAVFEACASQEYNCSLADSHAHAMLARQVPASAKWPVRVPLCQELAQRFDETLLGVLDRLAEADHESQRVYDSFRAFRTLSGGGLIA